MKYFTCIDSKIRILRKVLVEENIEFYFNNNDIVISFSGQNKDSTVLNTGVLIALSIAVIMILVVFVVIILIILIKQKGYIQSISEHFLGYQETNHNEVRWKVSSGATDETIHFTFQQEHP